MRSLVAAGALLILSTGLAAPPAAGQDLNPYGRIDPVATSISVVHRSMGANGSPALLTAVAEAAPPEVDRLLEAVLDHPSPVMRTTAAAALSRRGVGDPRRLIKRLPDDDARAAYVVALLGAGGLDPELAAALLDDAPDEASGVATAMLAAAAGRTEDLRRLATMVEDDAMPPLARGIAAGRLEATDPGRIAAWRKSLSPLVKDAVEATIFATASTLGNLGATAGLQALERIEATRTADDIIRATLVLELLRADPDAGLEAWRRLAADGRDRMIPTSLLLVSAKRPFPEDMAGDLARGDAMQQAVNALLLATPADRPKAAEAAVREGHLPTIRWLLELPAGGVPPEVLDVMIETALTKRRSAMIEVLLEASRRLAEVAPDRVATHLAQSIAAKDDVTTEAMLRALVAAASPEAAAVAASAIKAPDRRTRSLALLAVARGGELDGPGVRRLGLAAAGGGDLPDDLRPLAAWHHLLLEQRSNDALVGLVDG